MLGLATDQLTAIGVIAGVISAVIAVIGLPLAVLAWRNHLIDDLTNNKTKRDRVGRALGVSRIIDAYRSALEGGLDKLDRWMGGYRDLSQCYGWCVRIALGYAAGCAFLPWLLFGLGTGLGDLLLLPDAPPEQPVWQRAVTILALLVALSIMALVMRNEEQVNRWGRSRLYSLHRRGWTNCVVRSALGALTFAIVLGSLLAFSWAIGQPLTATQLAGAVAIAFAVAFAEAFVFAVAGAIAIAFAVTGAGAFAVAGAFVGALVVALAFAGVGAVAFVVAFAGAVAVAFAGAGAVGGAVAGAVAFAFAGAVAGSAAGALVVAVAFTVLGLAISGLGLIPSDVALAWALFLAVLPLINGLLDWPSWLVSRALGSVDILP